MLNICKVKREKEKNSKSLMKLIIQIKNPVCLIPKTVGLQLLCMWMMMTRKKAKSQKHLIVQTMNSTNNKLIRN